MSEKLKKIILIYYKLNDQKSSNNDKNILFHAAPISSKVYPMNDQTGAFFVDTGALTQVIGKGYILSNFRVPIANIG